MKKDKNQKSGGYDSPSRNQYKATGFGSQERENHGENFRYNAFYGSPGTRPLSMVVGVVIGLLIIVTPFAGLALAACEKPSVHITAGTPEPSVNQELHKRGAAVLPANEHILFVATPEPGHEGMAKFLIIPFAIFWTMFAVFWVSLAVGAALGTRSLVGWFMVAWGMPFIAVGVFLLTTPYFAYKRELHTIYAITDNRALSFTPDGARQIVAFNSLRFGPIEAKNYSPTRTDIMFKSSSDPESPGLHEGFWAIENGIMAQRLLEQKYEEAQARK